MQGVGKTHDGILVLGATNVPWELDPAMRRRFEKRIYIALPEWEARSYMAKLNLGDTPSNLVQENFDTIGRETDGYSGSDLATTVREALMEPLRQCQVAEYFFKTNGSYLPCDASTPGAEKMTLMEVVSNVFFVPKLPNCRLLLLLLLLYFPLHY